MYIFLLSSMNEVQSSNTYGLLEVSKSSSPIKENVDSCYKNPDFNHWPQPFPIVVDGIIFVLEGMFFIIRIVKKIVLFFVLGVIETTAN